ncbi:MAG: hypothetical protein K6G23_09265 [Lachnospiraceae bacterium]|nr:hypothetical protein [Lachnospiraceae bacterium]
MFIEFACFDVSSDSEYTEICCFYGIRYNRQGFAVLSTEHRAHDYLLPMNRENYDRLEKEISDALTGQHLVLQGTVYRVRRGAFLPVEKKVSQVYHLMN